MSRESLDMISQDPSISKSNRWLHVDIFQFSLIITLKVYSKKFFLNDRQFP